MNPGQLSTGKKLLYNIPPVVAILMCLFYGFLIIIALIIFGPFNQGGTQGFMAQPGGGTGAESFLWLLGAIPLAAIVVAIVFNYRIIRMIYGKAGPSETLWKANTIIVSISLGLMLLSTVAGLVMLLSADYPLSGLIGSLLVSTVQTLIVAAIMLFPYWLRKKLSLSTGIGGSASTPLVAPPPAGLATTPTELPGSNLQSGSDPATAPAPAVSSDTPKPQS